MELGFAWAVDQCLERVYGVVIRNGSSMIIERHKHQSLMRRVVIVYPTCKSILELTRSNMDLFDLEYIACKSDYRRESKSNIFLPISLRQ